MIPSDRKAVERDAADPSPPGWLELPPRLKPKGST
jgi:hypothetical protein